MDRTVAEGEARDDRVVAFAVDAARPPLILATALVSLAGLVVEGFHEVLGLSERAGLLPMLSLSHEQNLPTCFTALLLVVIGALVLLRGLVARSAGERHARHWFGLALAFLYIAFDEVAEIHEHASVLQLGGALHFSWVVPAAVIVFAVGVAYLRFLAQLPPRTRLRFVLAGTVYVGGALVMELPLGYWTHHHGSKNLGYALIDWVEETMELGGLTWFLLAMLDEVAAQRLVLRFLCKGRAP